MNEGVSRERVQASLDELTERSQCTGIVVSGCGCYDSPRLLVDGPPGTGTPKADPSTRLQPEWRMTP